MLLAGFLCHKISPKATLTFPSPLRGLVHKNREYRACCLRGLSFCTWWVPGFSHLPYLHSQVVSTLGFPEGAARPRPGFLLLPVRPFVGLFLASS